MSTADVLTEHQYEVPQHSLDYEGIKTLPHTSEITFASKHGLDLNEVFNELPVRIIGTGDYPMFYAADIGRILGISSHIRNLLMGFSSREIVPKEIRDRLGIITYRSSGKRHDGIVLLTEFGVYRLMFMTESKLAETFREWVYDVIHKIRTVGAYLSERQPQELQIRNEIEIARADALVEENSVLRERLDIIENLTDKLYIFQRENDYKKIQLSKDIPDDDQYSIDDGEFSISDNEYNTIDDWEAYSARFPADAQIRMHSYKLTAIPTPSDHTNYVCVGEFYTRNSDVVIAQVRESLARYLVGKNVFACSLNLILGVIDELEDHHRVIKVNRKN